MKSENNKFRKEQIIESKVFIHRKDILNVILEDSKAYTLEDADKLIKKFEKEKVN